MTSVFFRVDATREIGLGHLRRCTTLAEQFRVNGCEVAFVCRSPFGPEVEALVAARTVHWLGELPRGETYEIPAADEILDADATLSVIGRDPSEMSWVVIDSYQFGHRWERRVRDAGHLVMAIDDFRNRLHHADLLVSDSEVPFATSMNECGDGARTLLGHRYVLIDPDYEYRPAPKKSRGGPRRLLVTYGGSDPTDETRKAVAAVESVRNDPDASAMLGRVDIVVGPLNSHGEGIARAASRIPDCFVHAGPASLAKLMKAADVVLTAGGNSMTEALALRKPCLVTSTGANQTLNVDQLAAERLILALGASEVVDVVSVAAAIRAALKELDAFALRVDTGSTFDHLGAQRIVLEMLNWPARKSWQRLGGSRLPGVRNDGL